MWEKREVDFWYGLVCVWENVELIVFYGGEVSEI